MKNSKIRTDLCIFFAQLAFINLISFLFKNELTKIVMLLITLFLFICSTRMKPNNEVDNSIRFYGFVISVVLFFILFKL